MEMPIQWRYAKHNQLVCKNTGQGAFIVISFPIGVQMRDRVYCTTLELYLGKIVQWSKKLYITEYLVRVLGMGEILVVIQEPVIILIITFLVGHFQ